MYSLRMSFWTVPPRRLARDAARSATATYIASRMGAVALMVIEVVTLAQRQVVEQDLHVIDGADGHADPTDLAGRELGVGVVAHLGGQVEGHRQAGLALVEQVPEALVGLRRGGEAGVLAHGPAAVPGTSSAGRRACRGTHPGDPRPLPRPAPGSAGVYRSVTSISEVVANRSRRSPRPLSDGSRVVSRQRSRSWSDDAIPTSL